MKKEPLNLKALWLRDYDLVAMKNNIHRALVDGKDAEDHLFHAKDVKSAVEWLKKEAKKRKVFLIHPERLKYLNEMIDQAFPDLIHVPHIKSTRGKKGN